MTHAISQSVTKLDHADKFAGRARFVGDYPQAGVLHGRLVRSPFAHARIVALPQAELLGLDALPGFGVVDAHSVPGENTVHVVEDDSPVFAEQEVCFCGDVVALLYGPDANKVAQLAAAYEAAVVYEELPAVLSLDEAEEVFFDYHYGRGEVDAAFAEAEQVYDEVFETGYQEQGYLEPQGIVARYDNNIMTVHGSLQCPFYVQGAVAKALGLPAERVCIIQDTTGGGFGGKEAFPSILACQVAVAAWAVAQKQPGREVRIVFDRREDMEFTSKRHPSRSRYRAAVRNGRVVALDIDVCFNAGAFTTLTPVVLQRGIIAAPGVYNVPALRVHGRALRTNTVPTGAYRGFGAPQTFFAIERLMDHVALDLGLEPLDFKLAQLARQGDPTSTGGVYHFPVPLPAMVQKVCAMSGYREKRAAYNAGQAGQTGTDLLSETTENSEFTSSFLAAPDKRSVPVCQGPVCPTSTQPLRGIGMALWYHGAGFTGSAERDLIKAVVQLRKSAGGQVQVLASNTDMGQGIRTSFAKIVAHELGISYTAVRVDNPSTAHVPNSGPTVASRSLMVVGELLRRAAARLRTEWREGEEQLIEEHYAAPDFVLPFDLATFSGDAYPTFAWGVAAVELAIDPLTGTNEVVGCWACFDVGTPADENIVRGQMEGGVLQGLGYASMEQMSTNARGRIRNNSYSDYLLPTALDAPVLEVALHVEEYPAGPYGAKGAGELPLVGIAPAFIAAAEQALAAHGTNGFGQKGERGGKLRKNSLNHIPLTAEETLAYLSTGEGE